MREGSGRAVRRRLARRSFRPAPPVRVEAQFAARAQVAVRRGGGGGESEEERGGGRVSCPTMRRYLQHRRTQMRRGLDCSVPPAGIPARMRAVGAWRHSSGHEGDAGAYFFLPFFLPAFSFISSSACFFSMSSSSMACSCVTADCISSRSISSLSAVSTTLL
ncbi:unnamed protein product [Prorocentrum cordatum]|uniref:Uncharacterized protein n=1 Tax=Prorocentrum cordatum TaxID=2364126 RepID=A0ABN9QP95_9DINO|nr:unnamed protein product [Polarella glacialis]